jgi:hypothetical protein
LAKEDFPLSVSAILNKVIDTEIVPEDDFTWNVSLNCSFGNGNKRINKRRKFNLKKYKNPLNTIL